MQHLSVVLMSMIPTGRTFIRNKVVTYNKAELCHAKGQYLTLSARLQLHRASEKMAIIK